MIYLTAKEKRYETHQAHIAVRAYKFLRKGQITGSLSDYVRLSHIYEGHGQNVHEKPDDKYYAGEPQGKALLGIIH